MQKSLKVGPHIYRVIWTNDITLDGKDVDGLHDSDALTIKIRATLPTSKQVETLIHEVFHACYWFGQLTLGRPCEERIVSTFGFMLTTIIYDNDWFGGFVFFNEGIQFQEDLK